MAKIFEMVELADSVIASAVSKYGDMPTIFGTVNKTLLKESLSMAEGNIRRLTVEDDGSILVWNTGVW